MNVIVRFYWQHDLDLVALNMHPLFNMGEAMRLALIAYARENWDFTIPLPDDMPYQVELDNCYAHFSLIPGEDDDVIACLNGFRSGFRNSALKLIFRRFLSGEYFAPLFNDDTYIVKSRRRTSGSTKKQNASNGIRKNRAIAKPKPVIQAPAAPGVKISPNEESQRNSPEPDMRQESNEPVFTERSAQVPPDPVIDLAEEEPGFNDGDSFDLFSAVNGLMG